MTAAPAVHDLLVTAEGYDRLCSELETLRSEGRRAMSDRLREARADGNLEDNPALFDLLEEQDQLERRIATLEARLAAARVAESNGDGSVGIGSSARLRDRLPPVATARLHKRSMPVAGIPDEKTARRPRVLEIQP